MKKKLGYNIELNHQVVLNRSDSDDPTVMAEENSSKFQKQSSLKLDSRNSVTREHAHGERSYFANQSGTL
jgi:hypothetical protein